MGRFYYGGGRAARSKYGNRKARVDGITFDSIHEAERYIVLRDMERIGTIKNLRLQVPFELIPAQREEGQCYVRGPHRGEKRPGKVIERAVTYIADFTYYGANGELVVEDAKGVRTEVYKIKRKLMLYFKGIRIREV
jgi:hypothetical protein